MRSACGANSEIAFNRSGRLSRRHRIVHLQKSRRSGPRRHATNARRSATEEVKYEDSVSSSQPRLNSIEGSEIAVHNPSLAFDEGRLALSPHVYGQRLELFVPELLVEFDDRNTYRATDFARKNGLARTTAPKNDDPFHARAWHYA